jgi:hypothetical protein
MKHSASLDERREPVARVNAFARQIRKLKQFRVRWYFWYQAADEIGDIFGIGGAVGVDKCPAALSSRSSDERQFFLERGWATAQLDYVSGSMWRADNFHSLGLRGTCSATITFCRKVGASLSNDAVCVPSGASARALADFVWPG